MKFLATAVSLISLPVIASATLTINTPTNVVQCQPILLSWSGGTAPYYLSVIPAGQVSAPALEAFGTTNDEQYTWNVDIPAGTHITVALKDNTGAQAYTDEVVIQASGSSCAVQTLSTSALPAGSSSLSGTDTSGPASQATSSTTANTSHGQQATTVQAPPATVSPNNLTTHKATQAATSSSSSPTSSKNNSAYSSLAFAYEVAALAVLGMAGIMTLV